MNDLNAVVAFAVGNIKNAIKDLPDEAMNWVPDGLDNSIAALVRHACAASNWVLGSKVLESPNVPRPEFGDSPASVESLRTVLDDFVASHTVRLGEVTDEVLARTTDLARLANRRQALLFGLWHFSHHVGQIALLARLWKSERGAAPQRS